MEAVTLAIYVHAAAGGVALLAGGISLGVTKGGQLHRRSGGVFFYSMLASALLSVMIAVLPGHYSPFLLAIGVFTAYLLVSGYISLRYRLPQVRLTGDRLLAYGIIGTGLVMIVLPPVLGNGLNIVLSVFGGIGLALGLRGLYYFRHPVAMKENWLRIHLAKMTGAYIASVTAFLVVNDTLPGLWNWFLPTSLGTAYIIYWIQRTRQGLGAGAGAEKPSKQ